MKQTQRILASVVAAGSLLAPMAQRADAQARVAEFTRPFVMLETGGHQAPVRSLIFTPENRLLLSAGMDKVVHVHKFADGRPGLVQTIRPANWRGLRGAIYTMALSPVADANGQRWLAVAGFGVQDGNITLYRFPGLNGPPTGDIVAQFPIHNPQAQNPTGHAGVVNGLAFSPDGRWLASCGNDGRVLLWDVATRTVSAQLSGPLLIPARALAYSRDGRIIAVGYRNGMVRVWDATARRILAQGGPWDVERPNRADPDGNAVLTLALSPDGHRLVLGRENGRLIRVDAPFLLNPVVMLQPDETNGPVEAVAISPDGRLVATSQVRNRIARPSDLPPVDSVVRLRRLNDPAAGPPNLRDDPLSYALASGPRFAIVPPGFGLDNLVYALAFSPDGRWLAFAGGDRQGITLSDLRNPAHLTVTIRGEGSSVRGIGFTADSQSVGFTRRRPDRPDEPMETIGFDLKARSLKEIGLADLAPKPVLEGWRVEPVGPFALNVRSLQGRVFPITLVPGQDGRWWETVFLPGNVQAGHPTPTLAVACEGGVAIYNLETGERTRLFAGHFSAVYAMAPSPDGKWLATGSSDQTVRLWRLAGCDRRPPLGATLNRAADGTWSVTAVAPLGFADAMGLKPGDRIEIVALNAEKRGLDEVLGTLDRLEPGTKIEFGVRRGADLVPLETTRRDAPSLSLFVGDNRDWVLWMPEGFYDTLLAGDRRFLGWHRNALPLERPTDYFAAEKFEAQFRQPRVLETLYTTADLAQALALVPVPARDPSALAAAQGPPVIQILAPANLVPDRPLSVAAGNLPVRVKVSTEGRSPLRSLHVQLEGQTIGAPLAFGPPAPGAAAEIERPFVVPLEPGRHRLNIVAENAEGKQRIEGFDVEVTGPPPREPRLAVLAIGAGGPFQDRQIPSIPYADADARDLAAFLVAPGEIRRFERVEEPMTLSGATARGDRIREAFARLEGLELGSSDTAIVVIEAHVLSFESARFLLATDSTLGNPPPNAPTADAIGTSLARLAERGVRVLLLLDGAHRPAPPEGTSRVNTWVRELSRRGVITFVASQSGPSRRLQTEGHGAFAQAVLTCMDALAQSRPLLGPDDPIALDDFVVTVVDQVKVLTGRKQFAACAIPETVSPDIRIFDPNRPAR